MGSRPPRGKANPSGDPGKASSNEKVGKAAFDSWLKRGLMQLYGDAAAEQVPPELLDLIEQDRIRRRGKPGKPKKS